MTKDEAKERTVNALVGFIEDVTARAKERKAAPSELEAVIEAARLVLYRC